MLAAPPAPPRSRRPRRLSGCADSAAKCIRPKIIACAREVRVDPANEPDVELHERRPELDDVTHVRGSRPGVVDGDADGGPHPADRRPERGVVRDRHVLGDLEDEWPVRTAEERRRAASSVVTSVGDTFRLSQRAARQSGRRQGSRRRASPAPARSRARRRVPPRIRLREPSRWRSGSAPHSRRAHRSPGRRLAGRRAGSAAVRMVSRDPVPDTADLGQLHDGRADERAGEARELERSPAASRSGLRDGVGRRVDRHAENADQSVIVDDRRMRDGRDAELGRTAGRTGARDAGSRVPPTAPCSASARMARPIRGNAACANDRDPVCADEGQRHRRTLGREVVDVGRVAMPGRHTTCRQIASAVAAVEEPGHRRSARVRAIIARSRVARSWLTSSARSRVTSRFTAT